MLPYGEQSPLSDFRQKRSPLSDFRQTKKQRETGVKRVETVGVYPLAHRRGRRNVPAVRRRRTPPLRFSENSPPVRDEHAPRSSLAPVSQCRKTLPQKAGMRPRFSRSEKVPPKRIKTRHQAALLHRPVAFLSNK